MPMVPAAAPADVQMVEVQTGPPVAALAIAAGVVATVAVGGRALTTLTAPADDDDEGFKISRICSTPTRRAPTLMMPRRRSSPSSA